MPRKSIYDVAALAVVVWMTVMLLGTASQIFSYQPRPDSEGGEDAAYLQELEEYAAKLAQMTRRERDALRDRDGIVWGLMPDWEALYPHKEETSGKRTLFDAFASWVNGKQESHAAYEALVASAEKIIDDCASERLSNYQDMVEFANRYDAFIGWDIVDVEGYNPVVMAEENYFITCVPRQDQSKRAAEIIALDEYCHAHGIEHFYITTPNDACRDDTEISNVIDFYNQNADRLQSALREAGVDTIDLRDELHAAGLDHHACFFQTDHHWRPETGRWAAGVVARHLNENYGFDIDDTIFDAKQWRVDVFHDWFLGSQGKKVTLARATPEDFKLFYPKFKTHFHIEIPSLDLDKSGSFSVFYRQNVLRKLDYYNQTPYSAYFYGDRALTRVHNLLSNDGKRVLVLGHSFDNCVLPFLAVGVEYLDSIDLREFTGDLETYLEQNRYDVVIELYTE